MERTDGIEGGAEKGGHDGEGHRGPGESPEAIRENFPEEMSQAGLSRPVGTGGEHQSLDGDRGHISPGALQIKTQRHL